VWVDAGTQEQQWKLPRLSEAQRVLPVGLDSVLVGVSEDEIFFFGIEALSCDGCGGEAGQMEGSGLDGRCLGFAGGLAQSGLQGSGDGVIGFREDEIAGKQMDGRGGQQSFARRRFLFASGGTLQLTAALHESVQFLDLASGEKRIFSQAGELQRSKL
jgi:hypothetical protein